jgi:hypothetical protein
MNCSQVNIGKTWNSLRDKYDSFMTEMLQLCDKATIIQNKQQTAAWVLILSNEKKEGKSVNLRVQADLKGWLRETPSTLRQLNDFNFFGLWAFHTTGDFKFNLLAFV